MEEFDYKKIEGTKAILELTEADTFFTLFLNDKEIGKGQNEFARHRFDITSYIKYGKNNIKIIFESAEKKAIEIAKKLGFNTEIAAKVGMAHDIAKEIPSDEKLKYHSWRCNQVFLPALIRDSNQMLSIYFRYWCINPALTLPTSSCSFKSHLA